MFLVVRPLPPLVWWSRGTQHHSRMGLVGSTSAPRIFIFSLGGRRPHGNSLFVVWFGCPCYFIDADFSWSHYSNDFVFGIASETGAAEDIGPNFRRSIRNFQAHNLDSPWRFLLSGDQLLLRWTQYHEVLHEKAQILLDAAELSDPAAAFLRQVARDPKAIVNVEMGVSNDGIRTIFCDEKRN